MKFYTRLLIGIIFIGFVIAPCFAFAATKQPFTYGAWLPFWNRSAAIDEFTKHMTAFKEISPFAYEVQKDGTLKDRIKLETGPSYGWILALHDYGIKVLPTVNWANGSEIDAILSNKKARAAHIKGIVALAMTAPNDGVDINYEGKRAESKTAFTAFIKELAVALYKKNKLLSCTIEARTPLTSRFKIIPKDISYVNDYAVIGKQCDEVRVMAYDQGTVDIVLNKVKNSTSTPYTPIADPDWVNKVITETIKTIPASKIVLGIPTYGAIYRPTITAGLSSYEKVRSITYVDAMALAQSVGVTPQRNNAGELGFTYTATSSAPVSTSTSSLMRIVSFADAEAIKQKIALAKKRKLKGVMLFKLDGDTDPGLWEDLK
jgi:spore germination protein